MVDGQKEGVDWVEVGRFSRCYVVLIRRPDRKHQRAVIYGTVGTTSSGQSITSVLPVGGR